MKVLYEVLCKNWEDFNRKISKYCSGKDFVFRGHLSADWKLESSFQRFYNSTKRPAPLPDEEDPFMVLIKKYSTLFGNKDKNYTNFETNDFVYIGQHYGLPTPLMDWSKTINKAVFFACCDILTFPVSCDYVAVYALKIKNLESLTNSVSFKEYIAKHNGFALFEPHGLKLENPSKSSENNRIEAQDGLFTSMSGISNLSLDLIEFFERKIYDVYKFDKPILHKFIIPKINCEDILKDLDEKSGINFASIYPDREGFAKQAKLDYLTGR
jgi:hypothetical protein